MSIISFTIRFTLVVVFSVPVAWAFDHSHSDFGVLLDEHVYWNDQGTQSAVDYRALAEQREELQSYLNQLMAVTPEQFEGWSDDRQLAFLINAYNAFTLELILEHYPLESIRDIGYFWQSPWKRRFFTLLGEDMHLDQVEHEIIREPGRYDEPRIHFAVNCASIGCPALRDEPYVADRLEAQLEDSTERFLRDSNRNRYVDGRLEISSIFRWYSEDFEMGWRDTHSVEEFLAHFREALGLTDKQHRALLDGDVRVRYLGYDWDLNEYRGTP